MKDIKCPICGSLEKNLHLEETDGWFVCSKCQNKIGIPKYMKCVRVPLMRINTAEVKLQ